MAKGKGGRPTVMTADVIRKLDEAFANGATDLQACFYAGIGKSSLYDYEKLNPEYSERKAALKAELGLISKNVLAKSIRNDGSVGDAKWYLERKEKNDFSLRTENTGADGVDLFPKSIEIVSVPSRKNES